MEGRAGRWRKKGEGYKERERGVEGEGIRGIDRDRKVCWERKEGGGRRRSEIKRTK